MSETLLAIVAGAGTGALLLFLYARSSAVVLAENGYLALGIMLAIYFGAHLVVGDISRLAIETAIMGAWLAAARFAMIKWLPSIGVAILAHALYDFTLGHSSGVVSWYPPLCVSFDMVVGAGLVLMLRAKITASPEL